MTTNTKKKNVILDFNLVGPSVVEASAGTGKTYTITGLIIRLLLGDFANSGLAQLPAPISLENILVMTFTRAATADLKRKIREKIHEVKRKFEKANAEYGVDSAEKDLLVKHLLEDIFTDEDKRRIAIQLLSNAEKSMDKASISTIHSFCGSILKRFATTALVPMDSQILADPQELNVQAVTQAYREFIYDSNLKPEQISIISGLGILGKFEDKIAEFANTYTADHANSIKRFKQSYRNIPQIFKDLDDAKSLVKSNPVIQQNINEYIDLINLYLIDPNNSLINASKREDYENILEEITDDIGEIDSDKLFDVLFMQQNSIFSGFINKKSKAGKEIQKKFEDIENALISSDKDEKYSIINFLKENKLDYLKRLDILIKDLIYTRALAIVEDLKSAKRLITSDDLLFRLKYVIERYADVKRELSEAVRKLYPIAIIDEFQDTDPTQFSIVKNIYLDYFSDYLRENNNSFASLNSLFGFYIVGDPKQSIYSFRGAEVNCYTAAVKEITCISESRKHVLNTNYRSDVNLVEATNTLFDINQISDKKYKARYGKLDFSKVGAQGKPDAFSLSQESSSFRSLAPCKLIGINCQEKQPSRSKLALMLARSCANEIVNALKYGSIGNREICFADIAILVRSKNEAEWAAKALAKANLPAVYYSDRRTIYQTEEFKSVLVLMQSVVNNKDRNFLKQLLMSSFFMLDGYAYNELVSDAKFEKLMDCLTESKRRWYSSGFMAMFEYFMYENDVFLDNTSVSSKLQEFEGGSLILTNLMHSAEIALNLSLRISEPGSMIPIFEKMSQPSVVESADDVSDDGVSGLRLPSENNVIKIMSYHTSKGLEFPLVFMPFTALPLSKHSQSFACTFYDQNENKKIFDIRGDQESFEEHNEQEAIEGVRLWYVAATRAIYAMYIWSCCVEDQNKDCSPYQSFANSAFGEKGDSACEFITTGNNSSQFEYYAEDYDENKKQIKYDAEPTALSFNIRIPDERLVDTSWRITSYSSITQFVGALAAGATQQDPQLEAKTDEAEEIIIQGKPKLEEPDNSQDNTLLEGTAEYNRFNFARGANAGTFLHAIMEDAEFTKAVTEAQNDKSYINGIVSKEMKLNNISRLWRLKDNLPLTDEKNNGFNTVVDWMLNVMRTPVISTEDGDICLSDIEDHKCLKELEFLMTIDNTLSAEDLNRVVDDYYQRKDPEMYSLVKNVRFADMKGFLNGFIDLLVQVKGKFYVIDYKSNHLGNSISNYDTTSIKKAIAEHRYDLQYIIYTVAVQRFLKQKYGDKYDYSKHIGGISYLFLRGMNGRDANHGVYQDFLSEELINSVDRLLSEENN